MKASKQPSTKRATEGYAVTTVLCAASTLIAPQTQAQEAAASDNASADLPTVIVEDVAVPVYKPERVASTKYQQPLVDIPQTITVVPKEVIQEQNATNLRDVLRNVPGVTMQAGEGGVPAGDNMSIRGFNARTDMFVDGIRDFGGYTRDPFMLEQVEVSKGPTGSNIGRGSTGGSINLVTKLPHLTPSYGGSLGGGTDNYFRSTLDINQPIYLRPGQPTEVPGAPSAKGAKDVAPVTQPGEPTGIALRLNGLYHSQDTPGRNGVEQERWGLNASLGFGLGTDTRLYLNYFFMDSQNEPDYGIPWVPGRSTTPGVETHYSRDLRPNQAPNVNFDNWYGIHERDFERTRTNIISAIFEHDFNDNLSVRNHFRYGKTERDSVITAPRFASYTIGSDLYYDGTLNRQLQSRDQEDSIIADQLDFTAKFETGALKHTLTVGAEFSYEESENHARTTLGTTPQTNIFRPTPNDHFHSSIIRTGAVNEGEITTVSAYVFDHVEIGEHWEISGGLRWDWVDSEYKQKDAAGVTTIRSRQDDLPSWRAGLVYKPTENGSIYFGYGTSFNPSGEAATLSNDNVNLKPEENRSYELGTKWNLFDNRLQVSAALFRTEKTNARTSDPTDPLAVTVLDGEQVVQGVELGLAGAITDKWRIFAGYTYMDSEITSSRDRSEVGNRLANTPEHTFNLWTVYDLPWGFQIGGGVQYVADRFNNNANSRIAPDYWLVDAMLGYKVNDKFSIQLNVHNLTDEDYIDRPANGHFIPGEGRSVSVTANFKF